MSATTTIFRSFDPISVELAEAHLRAAEIPFIRLGRGNAALLGVGNSIVEQSLQVDAEHAERARELLTVVAAGEPARLDEGPQEEGQKVAPAKLQFIGGGLSLLWPGLGLAYAGFPLTGLALAGWAFFAFATASQDPLVFFVFGALLPRIVDLVATQHWLRRFGRLRVSLVLQGLLAVGLVAAFVQGASRFSEPLNRWFFPAAVDVAAEAEEPA